MAADIQGRFRLGHRSRGGGPPWRLAGRDMGRGWSLGGESLDWEPLDLNKCRDETVSYEQAFQFL